MLFDKKIDPRCAYCKRGTMLEEEAVLCGKRGVVAPNYACRSFKYDPFKRTPPKPIHFDGSKLKDEDFSL